MKIFLWCFSNDVCILFVDLIHKLKPPLVELIFPKVKFIDLHNFLHGVNFPLFYDLSYSTEVHFTREGFDVDRQLAWLRRDLQEANANRDQRPWVIAFGHRPMYCSNNDRDDCTKEESKVRHGYVNVK